MASHRLVCCSAALLLATFAIAGCHASFVDRGATLYAERNYIEADQVFEHNEAQLADASASERARYSLYRASTYLSLGDAARARKWLVNASAISRSEPNALSFEERRALATAWHAHAALTARATPSTPNNAANAPVVAAAQ